MLTISRQQLDIFVADRIKNADLELAQYAKRRFPALLGSLQEDRILALVRMARASANIYKIERDDNIAEFLDLSIMYGEDFHLQNWASAILLNEQIHGPDRMALLVHKVKLSGVAF